MRSAKFGGIKGKEKEEFNRIQKSIERGKEYFAGGQQADDFLTMKVPALFLQMEYRIKKKRCPDNSPALHLTVMQVSGPS